jgi:hypothetical protein
LGARTTYQDNADTQVDNDQDFTVQEAEKVLWQGENQNNGSVDESSNVGNDARRIGAAAVASICRQCQRVVNG